MLQQISILFWTWVIFRVQTNGRKGGRSRGLSKEAEMTTMLTQTLYNERKLGVNEIATELTISKRLFYNYLRHRGVLTHGKN